MPTPLAAKMGLKTEARACLVGAPAPIADTLAASGAHVVKSLSGAFAFIHAFFERAATLDRRFPTLARHLAEGGSLWISWPKGGQRETDLSLGSVIAIGYRHGLVESKTIGVDATWSAIKFTRPRKGKAYHNSYGRLPQNGP
jgi:hypothetical protein